MRNDHTHLTRKKEYNARMRNGRITHCFYKPSYPHDCILTELLMTISPLLGGKSILALVSLSEQH